MPLFGWKVLVPGLLLSVFFTSCSKRAEEILVDVKAIVNKDAAQVESLLGKPDSVYIIRVMGKPIPCQYYKQYDLEIQFLNARATDIVFYKTQGLPFNQTALAAFNVDYRKKHPSDYRKGSFIRWSNIEGFSAITFYSPKKDSANNIIGYNIFFKARDI